MAKAQAKKPKGKSDFFSKISKLKKGAKLGILIASVVALVGGFYVMYYMPYEEAVAGLEAEVATLTSSVATEQSNINKHKPIAQFVEPVGQTYEYLHHYLTTENEIPKLIQIISDLGARAGARVTLFAPKAAIPLQDYAEIEFSMNLEGSFLNVLKFFYSLSQMDRIINIKSVVMDSPAMGDNLLMNISVKCIGSTYRTLTVEEIALAATSSK